MKIGIDKGHNCIHNTGARGIKFEDDLTRAVGDKVIEYLKQLGHQVTDCTPVTASSNSDALYKRTTVANRDNVDLFVSIHFNAGGGKGSEVFAVSSNGVVCANKVLDELISLGFTNRGVKYGGNLYVIRHTNMPAILIEVAFVDSQEDMNRYDLVGVDRIAKAIAKGLTGQEIQEPVIEKIEKVVNNMNILDLQRFLNKMGVTDYEGKALVEDGIMGKRTQAAKDKAKAILQNILA